MRKLASVLVASILLVAACSSSSGTQQPAGTGGGAPTTAPSQGGGGGGADNWSGNGSAKVTIGGTTVTISPGGCYDGGSLGVDFRFGAWDKQTDDWIIGIAHHDGSQPEAISGSVGGKPFVLGTDVAATIGADGKGTFSGTDSVGGNGKITATFSCS
ncbi:MAG: hypothetical protein ABSE70_03940 [Candidatus Limnocylindrales bacterium]